MKQPQYDLDQRWQLLMQKLGVKDTASNAVYELLLEKHQEPHRYYHNLEHIHMMLRNSEVFPYAEVLQLAIWFHDAIYDPSQSDNEELSAELADRTLTSLALESSMIKEVKRLILLTKHHKANPDDKLGQQLCDLDLQILGSDKALFIEYSMAIRKEFEQYPDDQYNAGRKRVLQLFLDKESIYQTCAFNKYEAIAKKNIKSALKQLNHEKSHLRLLW